VLYHSKWEQNNINKSKIKGKKEKKREKRGVRSKKQGVRSKE